METKREVVLMWLFAVSAVAGLVGGEFLIFWNPEAREDWSRMLPCAIMSPVMFMVAVMGVVLGIWLLITAVMDFGDIIFGKNIYDDAIIRCAVAGVGLVAGGGTVYRWIKYIVVDNLPAFGYNPDNVYAVVGLNTLIFLPVAALVGFAAGSVFGILAVLFARVVRILFIPRKFRSSAYEESGE